MHNALRHRWRRTKRWAHGYWLRHFWRPPQSVKHGLPAELIVSLTSYPPRFYTLDLTLKTLLSQSVRPDRLILWIDQQSLRQLPDAVKDLTRYGLTIGVCQDLRSYKKLIPALRQYPQSAIVTADDDVAYPRRWLEALIEGYSDDPPVITYHRGHQPTRRPDGSLAPYRDWCHDPVTTDPFCETFPTGVGGILYPPTSLSKEVLDQETFTALCPSADDIWFYWMGRRAGAHYRKVGERFKIVTWPGSQEEALLHVNVAQDANDMQIRRMTERFGPWPPQRPI